MKEEIVDELHFYILEDLCGNEFYMGYDPFSKTHLLTKEPKLAKRFATHNLAYQYYGNNLREFRSSNGDFFSFPVEFVETITKINY